MHVVELCDVRPNTYQWLNIAGVWANDLVAAGNLYSLGNICHPSVIPGQPEQSHPSMVMLTLELCISISGDS